jgi:FkbM family methyltransferase
MTGWGTVIAIEAQQRIYYALAGNITINNCFNAHAIYAAAGAQEGMLRIPTPNYLTPSSFGSLELRQSAKNEFIGQQIDYSDSKLTDVRMLTIDGLGFNRLDLLKVDVEGMELEVLAGAKNTLERFRPIVIVERLKTPMDELTGALRSHGYEWFTLGLNLLAVHPSDPSRQSIRVSQQPQATQ